MSALAKTQKIKAEDFINQANALLAKRGWFSSSQERNQEEAAEAFQQAANAYKVGGMAHEAGQAYIKAAELFCGDVLKNPNEAAKAFTQAGTSPFCFFCVLGVLWVGHTTLLSPQIPFVLTSLYGWSDNSRFLNVQNEQINK
jgi:Soluble NSF attachment protein, SNAP